MNTWDERRVIGPAALTRWMSQFRGRHAATDVPDCSGECCSLSDKVVNASDGHATLLVACYHLDSGDVAFPHSLIFAANAAQLGP